MNISPRPIFLIDLYGKAYRDLGVEVDGKRLEFPGRIDGITPEQDKTLLELVSSLRIEIKPNGEAVVVI